MKNHVWLKGVFCTLALVLYAWGGSAKAQAPYYYTDSWGGYPFGWGYFGYTVWPVGYWTYPYQFGYHYYDYYPLATVGVLAWSQTEEVGGFAWGQNSIDAAADVALNNCAAADCEPVVWVRGGCAALATSPVDKRLGWAYADSKYRAISAARRACANSGGIGCTPRGWVCSF